MVVQNEPDIHGRNSDSPSLAVLQIDYSNRAQGASDSVALEAIQQPAGDRLDVSQILR